MESTTDAAPWFCCTESARGEVRVLAVVDLSVSLLWLVVGSLMVVAVVAHPELVRNYVNEDPASHQDLARLVAYGPVKKGVFLSVLILRPVVAILLAIATLVAAQKRILWLTRACVVVFVAFLAFDVLLLIPRTIYSQSGQIYVLVYIANLAYSLYELRALVSMMTQLRIEQKKEEEGSSAETEVEEMEEEKQEEKDKQEEQQEQQQNES